MQAKRFTSADRIRLEELINEQMPLAYIAKELEKHPTSISREVKRNRTLLEEVKRSKFRRNPCEHALLCTIQGVCNKKGCIRRCVSCEYTFCDLVCTSFTFSHCKQTLSWPFVCNRCRVRSTCPHQRYYYQGKKAQEINDMRASASRRGIDQDATSLAQLDEIITPLIMKGQSPFHIWVYHRYELNISLATFYSYLNQGLFKAGRMHLPRAIRFRPRKKANKERRQKPDKLGRTYDNYLSYLYGEE